jgi:hypothetical protein
MPTRTDVPALIPLSLLEALRNLDTPQDDGMDEVVADVVVKRFGLSSTVAAQIERYEEGLQRNGGVPRDEALGVFRLVGRRSDAALAFADAGRRAARYAANGAGAGTRTIMRMTPEAFSQRVGFGAAARVARQRFGAELRGSGKSVEVRIDAPLSVDAMPAGEGCSFYGSLFAELVRVLAGMEGAMRHERCRSRGDAACVWRWAEAEGYR